MSLVRFASVAVAAAILAACATSETDAPADAAYTPPPTIQENVRIPFASIGGVRNWRALPDGSLLIESRQDRYYRATFIGSCPELGFASAIGFVNDVVGSLDRFSAVVVRDRVCRFKSLDQVADPRVLEAAPSADAPLRPDRAENQPQ